MALLYLVRHALTIPDPTRNMAEWQLDPAGDAELARLAALPHWGSLGRIVSSTEPKALLTAEAIRVRHGLPAVEGHAELRELRKAGWVGDRHDEVMAEVFRHPDQPALPGWETGAGALERFSRCVNRLAGEDLILVSHATVLSLFLASVQGRRHVRFEDWRSVRFPDYAVVDLGSQQVIQPFGTW